MKHLSCKEIFLFLLLITMGVSTNAQEVTCGVAQLINVDILFGHPSIFAPYKPGHILLFRCTDRNLTMYGQRTIECLSNGTWDNPFPKCSEVRCSANLTVNMRSDIEGQPGPEILVKPGHTVTLSCAGRGSKLLGPEKITCLSSGQWNVPLPKCVGGRCGPPPNVNYGDTIEMTKQEYFSGESVEYKCFDKYVLDDRPSYSSHMTCNNTEWTGNINCLKPCLVTLDEMDDKGIRMKYGPPRKIFMPHKDQMHFACQRGKMIGSSKQICNNGVIILPSCD